MLMMLPFEAPTIFEGIHKSYFRMPRVVRDQRSRFENDDLFRQLSHESAVKYIGFKERPLAERQNQFITDCYLGHTEISVVQSGNQFTLMFTPTANPAYDHEGCYIDKEQAKAHIKAGFILNGVCVLWRGWIDLQRLEGFGRLEFDEYRAYLEEAMAKQQADGKQQLCNSAGQAPLGRLNYAPTSAPGPPLSAINAVAAAAATTNSMLPLAAVGLNSSCLTAAPAGGPPPPLGPDPSPLPPVSLAESAAAHYGNAAIAAAAAAAFHQALSAGGAGGVPGAPLNGLHALGIPPGPGGPPPQHSLVNPHLAAAYTATPQQLQQQQQQQHHHHANSSPPSSHMNGLSKSPPDQRENSSATNQPATKRAPIKRPHEDASQSDEVDVVSDISAHELDLPPRRIFKSEPIASHHHHHHHHSQHKISRRAA